MMITLVSPAIEEYARLHTEAPDALLDQLYDETHATMQFPQMLVGALEGAFLRMLVRLTRARRVLEIGMFTGYSALMMAAGLPAGGQLITCDINPAAEAVARRYFARSPHGEKIQIRMGPALETIATLAAPFDLVFIDADKANYVNYYEAVLPLVPAGGLIVADNALWSGHVVDPREPESRAIAAFNDHVARDGRVDKVMLTVRDGMLLALKR